MATQLAGPVMPIKTVCVNSFTQLMHCHNCTRIDYNETSGNVILFLFFIFFKPTS